MEMNSWLVHEYDDKKIGHLYYNYLHIDMAILVSGV